MEHPRERVTITERLAEARAQLTRLDPIDALAEMQRGAVLIDTRTMEQRREGGSIPNALEIESNFLPWRVDPAAENHIPKITLDTEIIVICQDGYSSSLNAAFLKELGFSKATDVNGGFRAWQESGLPVIHSCLEE